MMTYTTRLTTIDDLDTIADHRYLMFVDIGLDKTTLKKDRVVYIAWLEECIKASNYIGLVIETDGKIVAGAGMWLSDGPPLPNLNSYNFRRATIVNVYTTPDHRRKGLARQLVDGLLDIAREKNILAVRLHASDAGRPLYESIGFRQTKEMLLPLEDNA